MRKNVLFAFSGIILLVFSCKPSFDTPKYDRGSADFTSFSAIGNSLSAGFADNALCKEGQVNSFPAMLEKQFRLVGGNGVFKSPFIDAVNEVRGVAPAPIPSDPLQTTCKLVLGSSTGCDGVTSLGPVPYAPPVASNVSFFNTIKSDGPFNNVSVPGIKSYQVDYPEVGHLNGNPDFNPYYARFASSPSFSTVLSDGMGVQPTFFTFWVGSNDVLGYAIGGGSSASPQPNIGNGDITPLDTFKSSLTGAISKLTATGAKGAIANVPDVTDIPFFTTIPYNGLQLTRQGQVDSLNAAYAPLGITFNLGANPFMVEDLAAAGGMRQIKSGELICLTIPQNDLKCNGLGSSVPIPDQYWLDAAEIVLIKKFTTDYNSHIISLANTYGLAHVDMNAYFKTVTKGIVFNGVTYTPEFVSGGAFSLDGIHPNQRGYALIANEHLRAINAKYGSTIPEIDVNIYKGIVFP